MGGGGGGYAARLVFCSLFPVQQTTSGIGHRVKYSSFFGLATNTLNVRNNNNNKICIISVVRCDMAEGSPRKKENH